MCCLTFSYGFVPPPQLVKAEKGQFPYRHLTPPRRDAPLRKGGLLANVDWPLTLDGL